MRSLVQQVILVQKEKGPDDGKRYAMKVLKKAMIVVRVKGREEHASVQRISEPQTLQLCYSMIAESSAVQPLISFPPLSAPQRHPLSAREKDRAARGK